MTALEPNENGQLADNIIYFAHALRRAGLKVGTAQIHDAIHAVSLVGFTRKLDFYATLRACFVTRAEDLSAFSQVFAIFWRDPEFIETMMQALMPMLERVEAPKKPKAAEKRAQEALMADLGRSQAPPKMRDEIELDSRFSFSNLEKLGSQDFEQMSAGELAEAEKAIKALKFPIAKRKSRRKSPRAAGKIDIKATLRTARKNGGEILALPRHAPTPKPPKLILMVDISGSMSSYSRMMLLFAHALKTHQAKRYSEIHIFTFGTRLTNVTRKITNKDPDQALADIGTMVQDWDGGTAIGASLDRFAKDWAKRVLGSDSIVVLISDGLDRGDTTLLEKAARHIRLSCKRFIWMNPLLRFDGFEPTAKGISALRPHVDQFQSAHNLDSFAELAASLSGRNNPSALVAA